MQLFYAILAASVPLVSAQADSQACTALTDKYSGVFSTYCSKGKNCQDACYTQVNTLLTQQNIQEYVTVCQMSQGDLRGFLAQVQVFNSGQEKDCGKPISGLAAIQFDQIKFGTATASAAATTTTKAQSDAVPNALFVGSSILSVFAYLFA